MAWFKFTQKVKKGNTPVSQSCAVAENNKFWRATGQSNLTYDRLATPKASKVWFSYSHTCTLVNGAVFHSVWQDWLCSGQPEFVTFSYCAWLWNLRNICTRFHRVIMTKDFCFVLMQDVCECVFYPVVFICFCFFVTAPKRKALPVKEAPGLFTGGQSQQYRVTEL